MGCPGSTHQSLDGFVNYLEMSVRIQHTMHRENTERVYRPSNHSIDFISVNYVYKVSIDLILILE